VNSGGDGGKSGDASDVSDEEGCRKYFNTLEGSAINLQYCGMSMEM
jgi:hypothetical protein